MDCPTPKGSYIQNGPSFMPPAALRIQATATIPDLYATRNIQDILSFRSNHFDYARVLQCGIRKLGTQHGMRHQLILGVRGKATDEDCDPYIEKVLVPLQEGMHINIALQVSIDTIGFEQSIQVEVTCRNILSGAMESLLRHTYNEFPSIFQGLDAKYFPHMITPWRSELLVDRNWCPYEKLDFHFQGELHGVHAQYLYGESVGDLPSCFPQDIIEGRLIKGNEDVRIMARRSVEQPEHGMEFSMNLAMGTMVSKALSTLLGVVANCKGSSMTQQQSKEADLGPYAIGLCGHRGGPTKWYTIEHLQNRTLGQLMDDAMTTIPGIEGQYQDMVFVVTGQ